MSPKFCFPLLTATMEWDRLFLRQYIMFGRPTQALPYTMPLTIPSRAGRVKGLSEVHKQNHSGTTKEQGVRAKPHIAWSDGWDQVNTVVDNGTVYGSTKYMWVLRATRVTMVIHDQLAPSLLALTPTCFPRPISQGSSTQVSLEHCVNIPTHCSDHTSLFNSLTRMFSLCPWEREKTE